MYEWDEAKRLINLKKHGIDFVLVKEIWQGAVLEAPSTQSQHGEVRWVAVGVIDGVYITVIYTERGEAKRLISARRARKYERESYQNAFG